MADVLHQFIYGDMPPTFEGMEALSDSPVVPFEGFVSAGSGVIEKKWDFKRIEPSLKPAPEFDARLLPDAFVDYVADAAYRMQVSPDYNACTIDAGFNCGMKLLLDEHISMRIIPLILEAYPESTQVELLGMSAYSDVQLWAFARDNGYILVTKDSDFNDLSALYGYPPKVIWLKCGKRWGKVIAFSISIKPQTLAVAAYNSVSTD